MDVSAESFYLLLYKYAGKANHQHMSEVQTWQGQQAHDNAAKCGILSGDLVCRPCRDDLRRISASASHVPRWKKKIRSQINVVCKDVVTFALLISKCRSSPLLSSSATNCPRMSQVLP